MLRFIVRMGRADHIADCLSEATIATIAVFSTLVLAATACGPTTGACSAGCPSGDAVFLLTCAPATEVSVVLSGPCASADAHSSSYVPASGGRAIDVSSAAPGACHVELHFSTGFTYSTTVQYELQSTNEPASCACSSYVAASPQSAIVVDNPPDTCTPGDAGD